MTPTEIDERLHDQARNELGFCVQAPDANWCDRHAALKFPGEEACKVMTSAYYVAELAGEVMEEMVCADLRAQVQKLHEEPYPHIFYGGEPTGWRVALNVVLILLDQRRSDDQ